MLWRETRVFWKVTAPTSPGIINWPAWLALRAALASDCSAALLTDGSPTCGSEFIYDGSFTGQKHAGMGIAAALLREHGIQVFSDNQLMELIAWVEERENDSM